jgi:hypothetical protein
MPARSHSLALSRKTNTDLQKLLHSLRARILRRDDIPQDNRRVHDVSWLARRCIDPVLTQIRARQGGDPTGTGRGGTSIYGAPFADEIVRHISFSRHS